MGKVGFEPTTPKGYGPKPYAYASSATCPKFFLTRFIVAEFSAQV